MKCRRYTVTALVCAAWLQALGFAAFAQEPLWPREWMLPSGVTYKLRGRIDMDALAAVQSEKNIEDFGVLDDTVGLRRARQQIRRRALSPDPHQR